MKFQTPKGTKDFLPQEMVRREYIIQKIKEVFESYGFEPMETPAFENLKLLVAKSGEDIVRQIFQFEDKAGRKLGLRFDLTISLARIVASNPQLPKPFKRYEIGPAWRYEEPQLGRMRQFYQADIDVCGSESLEADVECIACAVYCLKYLGLEKFAVRISNRKILDGLLELAGINKEKNLIVFRVIDKLDKIGEKGVKNELLKIDLAEEQIQKLLNFITIKGKYKKVLMRIKKILAGIKIGEGGFKELEKIFELSKNYGISDLISLDLSLARGLDYYTGPIFEIVEDTKKLIGTLAAGGRYNNLIELLGGRPTPATGISLGIERIIEIIKSEKMLDLPKTKVKVFVANVNEKIKKEAIKIAQKLRKKSISCQTDLMNRSLTKQLEFADSLGIPYVIIVGEKELKKKKLKLKDMRRKSEKNLNFTSIVKQIR